MRWNTGFAVALTLAISAAPVCADPTTAPSTDDAQTQARLKAMETQLAGLQKQLAQSYSQNKVLQDQNAALLGRLAAAGGSGPNAAHAAPGSVLGKPKPAAKPEAPAPIVVNLTEPQWDASGVAPPQQLQTGVEGTGVVLKPMDETIAVIPSPTAASPTTEPADATHLSFGVQHFNRGLGTQSYVPVGKIWLDGGVLYLQWIDRAHQPEAMAALQFAALQITGSANGATTIQFFKPTDVSISIARPSSTKLTLPEGMTGAIKLKAGDPPDGWQIMRAADNSITMKADDLTWQLNYGQTPPQLYFTRSGGLQQKLDGANAELKYKQRDLQDAQTAAQSSAQSSARAGGKRNRQQGGQQMGLQGEQPAIQQSESADQVATLQKEIVTLNQSIATMKTQIAANEKQWGSLDGSTVSVDLSDGAIVANVTLAADK